METVTAAKRRQIGEIKSFLAENGADGTLMSGSGPTVYGLFSDESRAKTAAKMLRRRFADTFLTETYNWKSWKIKYDHAKFTDTFVNE